MARGTCSVDGCDRMSIGRGLCGKHYQAARVSGTLPERWEREKGSLWQSNEQRILEKVYKDPVTGCWNWQAQLDPLGYGQTTYKNADGNFQSIRAHKLSWIVWRGEKPAHLHIRHKCDNKTCVNPDHLELGTHQDNMDDLWKRGGRKGKCAGQDNGRSLLSQAQADEIREIYAKGQHTQEDLGNMFGVSQFAISMIIRNKRYVTENPTQPVQPPPYNPAVTYETPQKIQKRARSPKQDDTQLDLF